MPSSGSALHAVADGGPSDSADHGHHVEFEPLREKLLTPFNWVLLLLMAFCGVSMVARFALGLGGSTDLSDTYPWGLVDPVRPRLDRRRRGSVRDGRGHLRLSAKGPLFAGPNSRADGSLELLVRDGDPGGGSGSALALLSARPAVAGALGHVRGLVVRRPLRHDPAPRVPAGRPGALGPPPSARALAEVVRRLRGVRRDAVRLSCSRATRSTRPGRPWSSARWPGCSGTGRGRRSSRSCWPSPRSPCPPCTRARSARCTC